VLNVIFWCSLVGFLLTHGFHVPSGHTHGQSLSASILVVVAAAIGVILLGSFGGLFYLLTRGQDRASRVVRKVASRIRFLDADRITALVEHLAHRFAVLMEDRSLTRRAIGWAAANWILDAASLWVFVAAFSHFISPVDLLLAYGLANILAAIPITPGGLGVVEFVLVSMITGFGPTAAQALSAVLAYRAVNFWLPIPFGGVAYASLEFERRPSYQKVVQFLHRRITLRHRTPTVDAPSGLSDGVTSGVATKTSPAPPAPAMSGTVTAPYRPMPSRPTPSRPTGPAARAPREPGPAPSGGPWVPAGAHRAETAAMREPAFGTDPAG
jgi:hypothetical protein